MKKFVLRGNCPSSLSRATWKPCYRNNKKIVAIFTAIFVLWKPRFQNNKNGRLCVTKFKFQKYEIEKFNLKFRRIEASVTQELYFTVSQNCLLEQDKTSTP